jgi:protein-S-isoprenylcysteine O-methyltransferase Ste14
LASQNWLVAGTTLALMSAAYARRIRSEESMLLSAFGESYRVYMASTWRLVPWLY